MSELKGTLLALVLALSVFSIIYVVIEYAIRDNSETIAERMVNGSDMEPHPDLLTEPDLDFTYVIQ